MSARLPLILAGFTAVAALLALSAFAAPAAAAPVPGNAGTGVPGCSVHLQLFAPAFSPVGRPFQVMSSLQVYGAPACSSGSLVYVYSGLPGVLPSLPMFVTVVLQPGVYHLAVLVHGGFGFAMAQTTITVR